MSGGRMLKITSYFKYHFPSFAVSFLLFLLVFSLFFSITKVNGFLIESWVLENERGEIGSTFQRFSKEPFTVFLTARISRDEVPFPGPLYLYIPQMYHSYLAVFADGVKIGSHGFVDKRSGYFWNWPLIFELPEKFSEITLEISGMYRVGTETGVYIVPSSETGKYMVLSFMVRVLIPITIGLSLAIGTVMFLLSNSLSSKERRIYMYLGIASVLGAVWLFDLIDFSDMNSSLSLLLFRKATISSAYFAFFFLLLGFSGILSKERKGFVDWVILVLNLIASVVLWMAPDLITMERFISSIAFVLIVNTIYLIFHLHRIQSRVLLGSVLFFIMCVLNDALVIIFPLKGMKLISNLGMVAMFIGFTYFLVTHYRDLLTKLTIVHTKSLIDPLTGAYNRGIFAEIQLNEGDTFVYIDIDDFKKINDTHGHDAGDEVLRNLVQIVKNHIRQSDAVVRMGGDEFLIILRGCSPEKAEEITRKILSDFEKSRFHPTFSYGVHPFTGSLNETLAKVDELMYRMKEGRKKGSA